MSLPSKGQSRRGSSRWPRALLPWVAGALVTWLTWPDVDGTASRESSVGLAVVALSFVLGPLAPALAYLPAVLAGAASVLLCRLALQFARG